MGGWYNGLVTRSILTFKAYAGREVGMGGWYNDRRRPMPVPTHPPAHAQHSLPKIHHILYSSVRLGSSIIGWILDTQFSTMSEHSLPNVQLREKFWLKFLLKSSIARSWI